MQEPEGLYSGPTARTSLRSLSGSARRGRRDRWCRHLAPTGIGSTSSFTGDAVTVVGFVENPPISTTSSSCLARAPAVQEHGHGAAATTTNWAPTPSTFARHVSVTLRGAVRSRGHDESATAAPLVLRRHASFMVLVSLVAAAAFVVVAQRRLRQLGMLAAIGATERHLRLVMMAHGLAVGVVAAVAGNAGLAGWFVSGPRLETAAQHRMDAADIPWSVVAGGTLLALFTTTAAAWWPARAVGADPDHSGAVGRPPRPKRVHRSAVAAVAFLAVASPALPSASTARATPMPLRSSPVSSWSLSGSCSSVRSPFVASRPLRRGRLCAARLAVRDLGRYQARAGAALAAISLGLGIAFAVIIVATASAAPCELAATLSDRQPLMRLSDSEPSPS